MFTADIEGLSQLESAWGSACNHIRGSVSRGVTMGVKEGAQEARARHQFQNRSGDLERSIEGIALGTTDGGNTAEGAIRATAKHASYVEEGTSAHIIRSRAASGFTGPLPKGQSRSRRRAGGPMLRFTIGGRVIFASSVRHPGSRPMPFMQFAYYKCEAVIIREIENGIAAASSALSR